MEMFQPQLSLSLEPDGEFTLDAVTITPNSWNWISEICSG